MSGVDVCFVDMWAFWVLAGCSSSEIDYTGFPPADYDFSKSTEENYATDDVVSVLVVWCMADWLALQGAHGNALLFRRGGHRCAWASSRSSAQS